MRFVASAVLSALSFFSTTDFEAEAMTSSQMTKIAVALGACFAAYKFLPHPAARAMALGVAGVIVGRQLPYVKDAL